MPTSPAVRITQQRVLAIGQKSNEGKPNYCDVFECRNGSVDGLSRHACSPLSLVFRCCAVISRDGKLLQACASNISQKITPIRKAGRLSNPYFNVALKRRRPVPTVSQLSHAALQTWILKIKENINKINKNI